MRLRSARLLDGAWCVLLALYVVAGTQLAPFHGDEATQIYMSREYAYQFIDRDLARVRYDASAPLTEQNYLSFINGSINKYTMGVAWHSAGFTVADINEQWDWGADWHYNTTTGHAPSSALLAVARMPSALFTAASVVVLFGLVLMLGGRGTAYLATAYYALNPAILLNGRRAMMEGSMLFFGLLLIVAGVWYIRRPTLAKALVLGVAAGLALSAKHTNLFTLAAVFGAIVLYPFAARIARVPLAAAQRRVVLLALPLIGGAAALVFFVLNPVWWGNDPIGQTLFVFLMRRTTLDGQVAMFGGYPGVVEQAAGFLRQSFVVLPQYYEVGSWGAWIADQIARYEASPLRGVSLGGSAPGGGVLALLIVVGTATFARRRDLSFAVRWLVVLWGAVAVISAWLLTPIEWQRYYLPLYPAVALFGALGARWLAQRLVHTVTLRRAEPSPATS